ncbi:hypothetical protein ACFFP0_21725 [Rhizobium puerariae]|uniref:Uncharacterized protein n=1 Tax=Rhizobium puerariae TaxID=1585791 RepID=A0ABV6ALQ0_9HYPH
MTPLQIFSKMKTWLTSAASRPDVRADDPFRDPDIGSMDLRQLADLPFPRPVPPGAGTCEKACLSKCA